MAAEFRQRAFGEYLDALKRRKWLLILPTLAVAIAMAIVVYKLPDVYQSTTLLTVRSAQIDESFLPRLSDEDLSQKIQTINKEVLSRSSLEPMVIKYDLYKRERDAGMPMELVIERMFKAIEVDIEETGNEKIAAFRIKYKGSDPQSTRNVAAELASKYVNEQVQEATSVAESTKDMFDKKLTEKKAAMDELANQRLQIMQQNVSTLPESEQGLVAQLTGLRQREDTIAKEKESQMAEKSRLSDAIRSLNQQMRLIEDFGAREQQDSRKSGENFEDSAAYAELVKKKTEIVAKLENKKKTLREKHPEIETLNAELAAINGEIETMRKTAQVRGDKNESAAKQKAEMQKQMLLIDKQRAETQIPQIEQKIAAKDQESALVASQIAQIEARLNTIPNVKVMLEGVNGQLKTAQISYDEMLKKSNDIQDVTDARANSLGEVIRVQDPANVPKYPVAPKRAVLTGAGLGIGLVIGLLLTILFELPRMTRIQNIEDIRHYTGLPVLASVPPLLSAAEKSWMRKSHILKVAAGIVAAVALIPVIASALLYTRVLEKLIY